MASSKFEVFGLVLVLLWGVTMAQSGCNAALVSMSPCLSYVTGNSSTPTTTCCTQLANVVQSQPRCLCVFTGDGSGAPTGMNINQTLALALPSACNIQTPPVSRCTEGANGPTSSTPSDTPSSGSGSKTTPGTIIAWYRKRKQKLMVFKVDFEKAFDYIRWDFLDLVMAKLGFGFKWRSWIHGCLRNARSSVLINGSPFKIFRGLRQGDPLSLFLFILAMEGFHAITCKSVETGIFRGVSIGQGVCVSNEDVSNMAKVIGCGVANLPLIYLGVPVGCNMRRCSNWNTIIQKFSSKLSKWKARLLSIGGRLSLIKSVLGNLPTYYMSIYIMHVTIQNKLEMMRNNFFIGGDESEKKMTWVSWKKCLVSKKLGGLSVESIFALNIGLLFKWLWRFLCQSTDLWAKVVKISTGQMEVLMRSLAIPLITALGVILYHLLRSLKVKVSDWSSFLRRHPIGGAEQSQFTSLLSVIGAVSLTDHNDSWLWSLDTSNGFSVASVRSLIDDNSLDVVSKATRWNRSIPIKVNVFLWRLMLNKLPTRVNLDRKGVDVGSILCPICSEDVESANHIFFSCEMAKDLWALFTRWELDIHVFDNFLEWVSWLNSSHLSNKARLFLEGLSSSDGTEEEGNEVDQWAEELGQPVDELERADALTLNVEPGQTVPVVGQQLQLLHMSKQTLRGNDARTFELIQVMGSKKITLPNESVPVNEPDQIKKITRIVEEHARLSGENDSMWLARCYKTFAENYLYAFTHYEAWDVLKNHHKWRGVKVVVPGRRVRTVEDIEEPNELF
ncbi:RNA-directed DNA polymerase, eukaryota, reverse transcriptase zinc-binding domain protein [Tanacetum coccineum]